MANVGGSISSNAQGGHDLNVNAIAKVGSENFGAAGGVFASGNDKNFPMTTGAFGEVNSNGHGLGINYANTHGVSQSVGENLRLNAFKNDNHSVDLNAFHSHTKLQNGLKFDAVGGNAAWTHAQGHAASVGVTQIPKFDMTTVGANATANLWQSANKASTFDFNTTAAHHVTGPFKGQNNFGANLGFTHKF